jgi:small subunit ribosomal protein S6
MKEYELTVLIHPDLEASLEKPLENVRALVTSNGGNIIREENWGKKRLAYKIKGQDFAAYSYFEVSLPADAPLKISSALNISDEVIRYLLVLADLKGRKALEEAKEEALETKTTDEGK